MCGYDRRVRYTEGEAAGGRWVGDDTEGLRLEPTASYRSAPAHDCRHAAMEGLRNVLA